MVLYTHLPNAKKKGVFLVLLGFIPFNSKPKQIPNPHAGYEKEKPELLNPTHIPTYTQLGTSQGIL